MAVAGSCSGNIVNEYLCTKWPGIGDTKKAYAQSDLSGGSTDLTPWHILRLTHQASAPDWGWSLQLPDYFYSQSKKLPVIVECRSALVNKPNQHCSAHAWLPHTIPGSKVMAP